MKCTPPTDTEWRFKNISDVPWRFHYTKCSTVACHFWCMRKRDFLIFITGQLAYNWPYYAAATQLLKTQDVLQAYNYVGNFMSLAGGFCSISCSLLLPSLFYMMLYRRTSNKSAVAGLVILLCVGFLLLVFITAQNLMDIVYRSSQISAPSHSLGVVFVELTRTES